MSLNLIKLLEIKHTLFSALPDMRFHIPHFFCGSCHTELTIKQSDQLIVKDQETNFVNIMQNCLLHPKAGFYVLYSAS